MIDFAVRYDYKGFFAREKAIRKSTGFPPYALILRVMVESEEDGAAMETLRLVYEDLKPVYEANRDCFLFFNKMKSPVKRMKNKYRYQALMRLCGDYEKIKNEIYERSLSHKTQKTLDYVEENPSSLS